MKLKTKARMLVIGLITALMLTVTATTASAAEWHRKYYNNYFKGFANCVSRGEGAIGHRSYDQRIWGAVSYVCYRQPRQTRYTMDILFDFGDYSGGGGGGGGGGSWILTR